jgi:hypothetical protein
MAGWTTAIARFFVKEDEPADVETDEDVRRALARLDRYPGERPAERRRPAVKPASNVISLWPR